MPLPTFRSFCAKFSPKALKYIDESSSRFPILRFERFVAEIIPNALKYFDKSECHFFEVVMPPGVGKADLPMCPSSWVQSAINYLKYLTTVFTGSAHYVFYEFFSAF